MVFNFNYMSFGTMTYVVGPINFSSVFWFDGITFEFLVFFFGDCYGIIWAARDHKEGQECKDNVFHIAKVQKKLGTSKFYFSNSSLSLRYCLYLILFNISLEFSFSFIRFSYSSSVSCLCLWTSMNQ